MARLRTAFGHSQTRLFYFQENSRLALPGGHRPQKNLPGRLTNTRGCRQTRMRGAFFWGPGTALEEGLSG
jgi:hypothetical protein